MNLDVPHQNVELKLPASAEATATKLKEVLTQTELLTSMKALDVPLPPPTSSKRAAEAPPPGTNKVVVSKRARKKATIFDA